MSEDQFLSTSIQVIARQVRKATLRAFSNPSLCWASSGVRLRAVWTWELPVLSEQLELGPQLGADRAGGGTGR